ncbi:MAG TPA: NADH-quinone oxidoreductase subunit NuoG [Solirubrobacterales bacterium]
MSPRREREPVTIVVDGVEVSAPEGSMLVDAAKHGDVEIPVFCYEPKLGEPVGACRMCLVEVEGIPKLQTACSTPIRDGMVVYSRTDRVIEAQEAVVEFLLVNHPLDCPVCDKGGECPLQDVAMGWGPGKSRMIDPKRHFQKPMPLSPLVRIDRERCILCYRCVRFSQEVAEDEQLQLLERGDRTFVGTFDDRPYIAPFHGNIIELCPVGALTSEEYRFRARPWDIEDAGTICTLCPSQCNVKLTVRDEKVARVLGRDNHEVDDGWLCDKGRFGFQMISSEDRITQPMIGSGGVLSPASWTEALEAAAKGLRASGPATAALVGGQASNEEGYLAQRIVRGALGSPHVDSRRGRAVPAATLAALADPKLSVAISALDSADTAVVIGCDPLHEMPILDLRLRKAVRRSGLRLSIASDRPSSLDGGAEETARYAPRDGARFVAELAAAVAGEDTSGERVYGEEVDRIADLGRERGVVIVFSERLLRDADAPDTAAALLRLADALELSDREGAGLLEVPEETNGRGLREAGCIPGAGPGYAPAEVGKDSAGIRDALESGELTSLIMVESNPVRDHPDGPGWTAALQAADFVVSVAAFADESSKHADVVFPAQTYAEKDGVLTHPDGRLQRVRPNIPNPDEVRPTWQVLVELLAELGHETGFQSYPEVWDGLAGEVGFYSGLGLDAIGGLGTRWPETGTVPSVPGGGDDPGGAEPGTGRTAPASNGALRLGTYRDLWADETTERNPGLRFLQPKQTLEIAPADGERLGLANGDRVVVSSNGDSVEAKVALRERLRPGGAFLIEGLPEQGANLLKGAETIEIAKLSRDDSRGQTP